MSNKITLTVIPFEQPAGEFLLSVMNVQDLIMISRADPRKFDSNLMETVGGIQREPSRKRIMEIADYAVTVDAAFPTPILLALDDGSYSLAGNEIKITRERVADIVDGQHRILGFKEACLDDKFPIPVVFLLEPTEEQKALIFATINGKQTKVPASIIYDLFGVTKTRSPQKTAHEIARAMNNSKNSPWYKRLKMLGKKTPESLESLSQGTFVKFLLPHISKEPDADRSKQKAGGQPGIYPDCIFNEYYRKGDDATILKIMMNVFNGAKNTWPDKWENPIDFTLTKTQGFTGIMRALKELVETGKANKNLSSEFFKSIFAKVKKKMLTDTIEFKVADFPSSAVGETKFKDMIIERLSS